jgi:DNA-binding MarR family transcriptional regulator
MEEQTSLFSRQQLNKEGKIGARQEAVRKLLMDSKEMGLPGLNNREIAENLHLPINTITPRVNELRKMGFVENAGIAFDPVTKRRVMIWRSCE